jgi:hypothetical protein
MTLTVLRLIWVIQHFLDTHLDTVTLIFRHLCTFLYEKMAILRAATTSSSAGAIWRQNAERVEYPHVDPVQSC